MEVTHTCPEKSACRKAHKSIVSVGELERRNDIIEETKFEGVSTLVKMRIDEYPRTSHNDEFFIMFKCMVGECLDKDKINSVRNEGGLRMEIRCPDDDHFYCICGHYIKILCFISVGSLTLLVGNCCVRRFKGKEPKTVCKSCGDVIKRRIKTIHKEGYCSVECKCSSLMRKCLDCGKKNIDIDAPAWKTRCLKCYLKFKK